MKKIFCKYCMKEPYTDETKEQVEIACCNPNCNVNPVVKEDSMKTAIEIWQKKHGVKL